VREVVLFSGGMDSTVALLQSASDSIALTINYGQPVAEIVAAADIALLARRDYRMLDLSFPVLDSGPGVDSAFRPGRNLVFLTLAAASVPDNVQVTCAAVLEDQEGFPDCRPAFFYYAEHALSSALAKTVVVHTPFIRTSKRELVERLSPAELEVVRLSVSCYRGAPACGQCSACVKRKAAGL
jgi:7-cyano-7-deazaguanine synthase